MGDFEKAVKLVLGFEGGVSDRPLAEDPGGLTNLGISTRFLRSIGDPRDVRDLTVADAEELYRRHFWDKVKGDNLPDPLAAAGAIGSATLQALANLGADPEWLANKYLWLRIRDYANRPSLELRRVNLSGWCNRVCNLEEKLFGEEG